MRTITTQVYKFNELTEEAKQAACEEWRNSCTEYAWCGESHESIEAFCGKFGVSITDYSVGGFCYSYIETDATNDNFRGLKLRNFTGEEMPTGYCLDCALWKTFFDEFKKTGSALRAFNEALDAGLKEWQTDMEFQTSDEYISEILEINGYEFTESGAMA